MSGLVVELCGLPGAGKTTFADRLVSRLVQERAGACVADADLSAGVAPALRLRRKAGLMLRAPLTHPGREISTVRLLGRGQRATRDQVAVPVQWWVTQAIVARSRRRSGVFVLEEGIVQSLWTAGLRSGTLSATGLVGLAAEVSRPDLVVHLDLPVELALGRLRERSSKHSRVQRLRHDDQLAMMLRGQRLLNDLLEEWRRRRLAPVLQVGGENLSGTDPVVEVLEALSRLHHATQPRDAARSRLRPR